MPLSSPLGRVYWKEGGVDREEVTQSKRTSQDKTQLSTTPNLKGSLQFPKLEHPSFPIFLSPAPFISPETGMEAGHPSSSPSLLSPLDASLTLMDKKKLLELDHT